MTLQAQILIVGLLLIVLAIIVNMIRRRRLELRYVLIWMGCDFALIILASFPSLMEILADILGIKSPMNMIFFLGFLFSLIIIFSLTVTISHFTAMVRKMAQEIALLSDRLNELSERTEGSDDERAKRESD